MKKFLLTLVALVGIAFAGSAQKTEITVGYGGYTQMDATDMHDGWDGVNTAWGGMTVGVNFRVTPSRPQPPRAAATTATSLTM